MAVASSLVATVVSAVFAWALLRRWRTRGRTPATLYWGIALVLFSMASLMLVAGVVLGWESWSFRSFYLVGAVLNVPWLALGSIAINARRRGVTVATGVVTVLTGLVFVLGVRGEQPALWWPGLVLGVLLGAVMILWRGRTATAAALAVVAAFSAMATVQVLAADLQAPLSGQALPEGSEVFPVAVRGLAVAGNAVGSIVVIASALISSAHLVWRRPDEGPGGAFREQRSAPVEATARWLFSGRRGARGVSHVVRGNLLIALGVGIAAAGGAFSFLGETTGHAIGLAIGVSVMYAGFVRTTRPGS